METDVLVRYDEAFIRDYEKLKELLDQEDFGAIRRMVLEVFSRIFRINQIYGGWTSHKGPMDFSEYEEEIRRELIRPLSHRQYRTIERAFKPEDDEDVLWAVWDFLNDNGRIYHKKVMSTSEVSGFSMIYEQACISLSHMILQEGTDTDPEQIARISYYETLHDRAINAVGALEDAVKLWKETGDAFTELEQYYAGGLWKKDFEDDEKGKLPRNLKRGVLSEDSLYNLLCEKDRWEQFILKAQMKNSGEK